MTPQIYPIFKRRLSLETFENTAILSAHHHMEKFRNAHFFKPIKTRIFIINP